MPNKNIDSMRDAVIHGDIEAVLDIAEKELEILEYLTPARRNWIHLAVKHGQAEMILCLAEIGVDPGLSDKTGKTPLYDAIHNRNSLAATKAILRSGADVNCFYDGRPMLSHVVRDSRRGGASSGIPFIQVLFDHGVTLDMTDEGGMTPLHWAAQENYDELALFLIKLGARTQFKTKQGFDVFQVAMRYEHFKLAEQMQAYERSLAAQKTIDGLPALPPEGLRPLN